MRRWALVLLMGIAGFGAGAQERKLLTRADGARVPIVEFAGRGNCPKLLVLSHGFGGTEDGMTPLARAASEAGFRAITIGHRESGRAQLRAVLRSADKRATLIGMLRDPAINRARMRDLDAVWDYATGRCAPGFAALAGHSMGAQLSIIEAGAVSTMQTKGQDRFDAYVALSPQGVGDRFKSGAWRGIDKPVLMITGTRDHGFDGWQQRLTAFEGLPEGHKWLAILDGARHMDLGGDLGGRGQAKHQRNVTAIVLAFLTAMGKPLAREMPDLPGVRYRTK